MSKKIFLLVFIVIFSMSCVGASQNDSSWQYIAPNNYIDRDGIVGLHDRYGFSFLLKSYNKGQYEPINGRKISYTLSQYELDCIKRRYKIGVIDSYDDDGFVNGDYNRYAEFQPIVQGTAVYEVSRKLCRP